jgi:hypothetical protein
MNEPIRMPTTAWQWAIGGGVTISVAMLSWLCSQLIEMRDGIRELKATVPIQIQDLDRRVSAVEGRVTAVEARQR